MSRAWRARPVCASCADAVVAVPGARSTGRLVRASLWARSDHKRKGYPWGFVERVTP